MTPKICVLRIEGTNCEYETYLAFTRLGAAAEIVHLKQLIGAVQPGDQRQLSDYGALVIPGGFSSGDYIRAGAILAARIQGALGAEIQEFIGAGKPILGICNGFQVLVELGLLPGFGAPGGVAVQQAALTTNDSGRFECRPTLIKHENRGSCVFTQGIERGSILKIPSAHAEGKFFIDEHRRADYLQRLEENDQIVFRYVDPAGDYAGYPWNPNGSLANIAGICNPSGTIMGLMPHPERVFHPFMDSEWPRAAAQARTTLGIAEGAAQAYGDGQQLFASVLQYLRSR
ncbi:MAG TPA: phosphoribosylformylglycinamidine synthase subunit PurQ [Methanomicrobia archaeon]|nr:phosphoribosylformylglycinamidine synthase subunit PurQ [Methanomicrobia archaeon]